MCLDIMDSATSNGLQEPDLEILDKLFTMFDVAGENVVNYKDFLGGCSVLVTGSVSDKLKLCFAIYDSNLTRMITRTELKRALCSINSAASFFGDPVVKDDEITNLIIDLFQKSNTPSSTLRYDDYLGMIGDHPTTVKFLMGQGTVRFGTK